MVSEILTDDSARRVLFTHLWEAGFDLRAVYDPTCVQDSGLPADVLKLVPIPLAFLQQDSHQLRLEMRPDFLRARLSFQCTVAVELPWCALMGLMWVAHQSPIGTATFRPRVPEPEAGLEPVEFHLGPGEENVVSMDFNKKRRRQ